MIYDNIIQFLKCFHTEPQEAGFYKTKQKDITLRNVFVEGTGPQVPRLLILLNSKCKCKRNYSLSQENARLEKYLHLLFVF